MIQHPELDGPFSVNGQDNRWNTTPGFYAKNAAALLAYKVAPSPLSRVWAGDNPAAPTQTVALAFPDAATATSVLASCGASEPRAIP